MCLNSKTRFPKRTKEPIVVYKKVRKLSDDVYEPEFIIDQSIIYKLGRKQKAKGNNLYNLISPILTKNVYGGYIHSYIYPSKENFSEKSKMISYIRDVIDIRLGKSDTLIKCVIPKGCLYYYNEEKDMLASKFIIPLEEININALREHYETLINEFK